MPAPHRETGIRLPRALRDELNLDDSGAIRSKRKAGAVREGNRKTQRKQQRQEKKLRRHTSHRQSQAEEDPFDISDASDIEALAAPAKKQKEISKPIPAKKPEPPSKKSILKPNKRKVTEDENEDELAPAKKKKSLSKGVLDRLAQDEAEIALLEKKLKIKNKKIPKSFEDDGLDFLLDGLDEDFLDDRKERAAKRNKLDHKEDYGLEEEIDDDGDDDDDEEEDGLGGLLGGGIDSNDGRDEDDEDEATDGDDEDDEFGGFSESESSETPAAPPKNRENPYKPGVSGLTLPEGVGTAEKQNVSKYIPPSLRKMAATESEQLLRLRRQIQGLINRLSEVKLVSILGDVEELYRSNPRADVTNILTDILVSTLCDPSVLMDTYHILHGGFLAGLYKIMGTDVGANVVQRIVEEFIGHHGKMNGIADPSTAGKECTNLMSFLSELYNFQVVGCVLIFDFIRMFLSELTELHTELLLKVVRNAGPQLRSDDPTALKSLVLLLQPAIAKAGGTEKLSVRTRFMIETLTNLKNNRLKSSTAASAVTAEHTIRMKKLLGTLNTRQLRATEPLRASLNDIRNTETKGKWWLVGASWAGASAPSHPQEEEEPSVAPYNHESDSDVDTAIPDLQALARQHRMNTDIRRAIFITLLSSTDYTDAHTRLHKLRLKRTQEREIPRVLLHCATAEPVYNPYYTLIATKLCASHPLRMTFTFTLWDYFRRFGEDDGSGSGIRPDDQDSDDDSDPNSSDPWRAPTGLRKIVNLARLYAALVATGSLTLAILKTLTSWSYLQAPTRSFLDVFFSAVLTAAAATAADDDEWEVSAVFGKIADNTELVRGVLHFLRRRVVKTGGVAVGGEEAATVKRRAKVAMRVLEGVLKAEVVGVE